MEINTPHFNIIANEILAEGKKTYSAKQSKQLAKPASKKYGSKKASAVLKKPRKD
jgi:hypothetical protein